MLVGQNSIFGRLPEGYQEHGGLASAPVQAGGVSLLVGVSRSVEAVVSVPVKSAPQAATVEGGQMLGITGGIGAVIDVASGLGNLFGGNKKWKESTAANVKKRYDELVALKTPNSVYKKMVAGTVSGPREMFPANMPWGPEFETWQEWQDSINGGSGGSLAGTVAKLKASVPAWVVVGLAVAALVGVKNMKRGRGRRW